MKKAFIFLLAAVSALAVSCSEMKQDDGTISVVIKMDGSELKGVEMPETFDVTITNFSTAEKKTAKSENGVTVFEKMLPGIYQVTATATVTSKGAAYIVTGADNKAEFINDGDELNLKLAAAKEAALIFKEIYYTGCKIGEGEWDTYFRDQFYEIYNNSNETVFADGLCICESKFSDDSDFTLRLNVNIPNADDYIFSQKIWKIPGAGTEYPIKPGESIILAQWGTDHRAEILTKGNSKMNLKGADFEFFVRGQNMGDYTLTDEDAINMELVVNTLPYMTPMYLLPVSGTRYILFKPSSPIRTDEFLQPTNSDKTTDLLVEIKIEDVIDGVEAVENEKRLETLGLPAIIDAGAIWLDKSYSGKSISRKVKNTLPDGRVIYQDTNNTTFDFMVNETPEVRRNGAKTPSWNTWNN